MKDIALMVPEPAKKAIGQTTKNGIQRKPFSKTGKNQENQNAVLLLMLSLRNLNHMYTLKTELIRPTKPMTFTPLLAASSDLENAAVASISNLSIQPSPVISNCL